jgi:hypothetical protein
VLAFALAMAVSLPSFAVPSAAATGWQQFRHSEFGFTISYPPGWDVLSGTGRAAFVAIGPAVEGMPGVRLGVVVVTARIPAGANVEEAGGKLEEQLARSAQTVRVLRTDRINLRGLPAVITYVHRRNAQGVDLYQMLMIVAHRARGYGVAGNTAVASPTLTVDTRLLQRIILTFQPPE